MTKIISVFNNKGGVGKSTICWNLADAIARKSRRVLLIDFDPQCNLSIAMLGDEQFVKQLPDQNTPYGTTLRSYLQRFLQNTGGEQLFLHKGIHTHENVSLIAGDFWLNVYAESLNVGADLLSGTGLSKYVVLNKMVAEANLVNGEDFDVVLVDLPPSFGALVRAAFCSSNYFIVPCTSDNFSVYCVGLIGQMVPSFVRDWKMGLNRFKEANPHFSEFDELGNPQFAGWVFNGFDTVRKRRTASEIDEGVIKQKMVVRADATMEKRIVDAVQTDLVNKLVAEKLVAAKAIEESGESKYKVGGIEDANVLIQNSIWQSVPLGMLDQVQQVTDLYDRIQWAPNQLEQIRLLRNQVKELADGVCRICDL